VTGGRSAAIHSHSDSRLAAMAHTPVSVSVNVNVREAEEPTWYLDEATRASVPRSRGVGRSEYRPLTESEERAVNHGDRAANISRPNYLKH